MRAIQWYRIGLLTPINYDKFNSFWIGLEALNSVLEKKLNLKRGFKKIKCDKCTNEITLEVITTAGVKALISERMGDAKVFRRFKKLRVNLMHSTCDLRQINEEANQLIPKIAEILFRAICFALDIQD